MNNIYVITNNFNVEVKLNFENNSFIKDNISYNFTIVEKDKLNISWSESNNETFYTDDSYLYYSENITNKYIRKIFLIHKEWQDQALINLKELTLKRIKNNDQYGNIILEDNKIIIVWNYWGKEIFIKRDNYTFIEENYSEETNIISEEIPIYIFIHICCINDWINIFNEQIDTLKSSGLYEKSTMIYLGILGEINIIKMEIFNDPKFNIMYIDQRFNLYEIHTINYIKSICDNTNHDINILYIHTKGVRQAGNSNVTKSWRNMMEFFLINNYNICLNNLTKYDTIGVNAVNLYCSNINEISINKKHTYHYSGNFWWTKKSYIDKLEYIELDLTKNSINTRYKAENWILSKYPDMNCGIIFQDDTNTHPYHRYVFDFYKDILIYVYKLNNYNI
jgi:hypothetical protein